MCGIFGFLSKDGHGPDSVCLQQIATETESRGRHAFGLAWIDGDGGIRTLKRPGAATARLADLDACQDAIAVIGHCRWATHGSPEDNRNNHPHPAGCGWLVHNGIVYNYHELLQQYNLHPNTDCDSEALGLLMMRRPGSLLDRVAWAVDQAQGPLALLGLWQSPVRFLIVRRGNPLSFSETPSGIYFASLPAGLPGKAIPAPDQYAGVLRLEDGAVWHQGLSIAPDPSILKEMVMIDQNTMVTNTNHMSDTPQFWGIIPMERSL